MTVKYVMRATRPDGETFIIQRVNEGGPFTSKPRTYTRKEAERAAATLNRYGVKGTKYEPIKLKE